MRNNHVLKEAVENHNIMGDKDGRVKAQKMEHLKDNHRKIINNVINVDEINEK